MTMRNFGSIRTHINRKLSDAYINESAEGKDMFKKYIKLLKEDTNLKNLFFLHKNLEDTTLSTETAAREFIRENISFFKQEDNESLVTSVNKVDSLVDGDVDSTVLHDAIHTLVFTERTLETLTVIHEAMDVVSKHILKEKNTTQLTTDDEYKPVNSDKLIEIAVDKYNKRYSELSETERNIIRLSLLDNEVKETSFDDLVKENLNTIDSKLIDYDEIDVREKLKQTKEKLNTMKYNEDSFVDDMFKLSALKDSVL
tara:strand:- start:468 stop:1235 length:768 start_codon:yes stop_codon:yes gene_type:complete